MGKLPELLIISDDAEMINTFSSNIYLDKCNLHLANKNDLGLAKAKSNKFDLILLHIGTNYPEEIQYFDKLTEINQDVPIIIISPHYKDSWYKIFGAKIAKFIPQPIEPSTLCSTIFKIIKGEKEDDSVGFSGKLDINKLLLLFKLAREFNAINDTNELFYTISIRATKAFGAERASVFVLNKDRTELISRAALGMDTTLIKIPVTKGVVGHVIKTGKTYITNQPETSPYFDNAFDNKHGFRTKNIICVPLKNIENETIGAFELINKKSGEFNSEDQFYLETMASTIAITLENTLLHHFLKRQVNEYTILKRQFLELENKNKQENGNGIIDDLIKKTENIVKEEEIAEDLETLRRMLKGNKKAYDCIDRIQDCISGMSYIVKEIIEVNKKE